MKKRITDFFHREADGSWTCTEAVSANHPSAGPMNFTKGAVFHPEDVFMGVKVAKWLDSLADARHK
jgi:hypothetical protein